MPPLNNITDVLHSRVAGTSFSLNKLQAIRNRLQLEQRGAFLLVGLVVEAFDGDKLACAFVGEDKVDWLDLRMTSEDFAFFAQKIPACYFRIGIHEPGTPFSNLHRPNLVVDERSLELANGFIAYNAMMALDNRIKS